jgi:hypothetical protein
MERFQVIYSATIWFAQEGKDSNAEVALGQNPLIIPITGTILIRIVPSG